VNFHKILKLVREKEMVNLKPRPLYLRGSYPYLLKMRLCAPDTAEGSIQEHIAVSAKKRNRFAQFSCMYVTRVTTLTEPVPAPYFKIPSDYLKIPLHFNNYFGCFNFVMVAQLVEALLYKPEGRGFDSRRCHWNFLLT
jgi:hypothetical protein